MHILHVLFTHEHGGLGQAHVNTTEALIAKGHKVTALMHDKSPYCAAITAYGAALYTMQPTGFYDIITALKIRRLLKKLRPDIILAHNARAIALLAFAARGTGITVVGVTHSYKTARTVYADVLVVLSEHMRQHFMEAGYSKRIEVIPNLIHLPQKFTPRKRATPMVIGGIGRFTIEKGFDVLIKALHLLKQAGVEFTARLGGDGEELPELRKLSAQLDLTQHIIWEGWVKDQPAFYREIDMICVPSREESFPLVVLEALAYGVPIVATDAPGPASIINSGVSGIIVPRGDITALARALQQLATNPDMAAGMAEAGWQRVQDFGFEAVADRWDKVLTKLLSS